MRRDGFDLGPGETLDGGVRAKGYDKWLGGLLSPDFRRNYTLDLAQELEPEP